MIYTITSTLPPVHAGRTKSLLSRIKLIDTELNIPTKILTTNYNANYPEVYSLFLKQEKVTKNTEYENIYEWLSDFKLFNKPQTKFLKKQTVIETPYEINGLRFEIGKEQNVVRYYNGDEYILYRRYYENSTILEFEDFMSPVSKKKVERWQYNSYGVLHRKIYYSPKTYRKVSETYYDNEGYVYCRKFFQDNETNQLIYIEVYKNDRPYKTFTSEKQLFQYYFQSKFKDNDIVFCDARLLDQPLLNISVKTNNVLVFHNSHLSDNKLKNSYKFALNNSDKVSKYILLTQKQKNDIQREVGITDDKINVIPHFIEPIDLNVESELIDRFVFIGRLSTQKQVPHIIQAYHDFLKSGYTTKLDLYGKDEDNQKSIIINLIEDLGISDMVNIYDFTDNPLLEFKKSKASLLTSEFEGFGLTVMESIEVGCPVLAYDVRYGPSEIINHGENGFLIEPNNIHELTSYMQKIIENPLTDVKTKKELKRESAIKNYKDFFTSFNL